MDCRTAYNLGVMRAASTRFFELEKVRKNMENNGGKILANNFKDEESVTHFLWEILYQSERFSAQWIKREKWVLFTPCRRDLRLFSAYIK